MKAWDTIKNHHLERSIFQNRIRFAFVAIVFLCLLLLSRMFVLQVMQYDRYRTASDQNRIQVIPMPPIRGLIFDRNGVLLAHNVPNFSLGLLVEQTENLNQTLEMLGKLIDINDEHIERFRERTQYRRPFSTVHLRANLTEEEIAILLVNRHQFPSIQIQGDLIRHYPHGDLFAHSIGYIGRINEQELRSLQDPGNYKGTNHIGKTGIEKAYEDELHGKTGLQKVETNAHGRILQIIEEQMPEPGNDLHLHLDFELQKLATELLGNRRGSLVAIEPKTGGVLAFVSRPSFDPNLFVTGISLANYAALRDSLDQPLFNRSIQGRYPPGSTIKPIIALAGLENNKTTWSKTINDPGWFKLDNEDRLYRDWKREGHGRVNLDKAIYQSCDIYFYQMSFDLGIDAIHSFMQPFGFGKRTGIDIAPESHGLLPSRDWKLRTRGVRWFPGETLIVGIGQGYMLATPLQLAVSTAILANKGVIVQPRLVASIEDANDARIAPPTKSAGKITLREENNWNLMFKSMENVMHIPEGTAYWGSGRGAKYKIAGKTGTAQVIAIAQDEEYDADAIDARHRDHSLFIGFAPADNPKIAIAIIVENAGGGATVAAPIARKIFDAYLL